jgi:tetratricopeptide (TPR) repeat protein
LPLTSDVTILHVSDFHFRGGDPYDRDVVLGALVESVDRLRARGRQPDLIFATGDLAATGQVAEYAAATAFFDGLLQAARLDKGRLFVVPGNHDVDRASCGGLVRTLESEKASIDYFNPSLGKPHITVSQAAFCRWYDAYFANIRAWPRDSSCGPIEVVDIRGNRLGVLPLNTALFCRSDDDHGKLWVGRRCVDNALKLLKRLDAHFRIALAHHPLDWLHACEQSNIRASLSDGVDILLHGHLHLSDAESTIGAHGELFRAGAGAAYQTRDWPNRALYLTCGRQGVTVFPIRYEDAPRTVWTVDPSLFPDEQNYEKQFSVGPQPTRPRPLRSNIPSLHAQAFVGRQDELETMMGLAGAGPERVLVLHGPPGVGKSELAREYGRQNKAHYPGGTFYVDAAVDAGCVDLAKIGRTILDVDLADNPKVQDQALRTLWRLGTEPLLLIYDNVTSMEAVEQLLPPAGIPCHVLMTTVLDQKRPGWSHMVVPPLSKKESLDLIERLSDHEFVVRFGEALATSAEGLPVQLVSAVSTLAHRVRQGRLDPEMLVSPTVETSKSFRMAYELLDEPVRLLVQSAALLNGQHIGRQELSLHLCRGAGWQESDFGRYLRVAVDLHFLDENALDADGDLRMHGLLAEYLLSVAARPASAPHLQTIRACQLRRAVELAGQLAANPAESVLASRTQTYPLAPQAWEKAGVEVGVQDGETFGRALAETGQFDQARSWFERAVAAKETKNEQGRIDYKGLGTSLHDVGSCLSDAGQHEAARTWLERAVEAKKKGDFAGRVDHNSLGESLLLLGYCLSRARKYDLALPWLNEAFDSLQKGDLEGRINHQSLGESLGQIGFCLERDEARPWFECGAAAKQKGDIDGRIDHDSVGKSLHQVGNCFSRTGKYDEAMPWFERAADAKQKGDVHGRVDHGSLGWSLHRAGDCLVSTGKYEEARELFERAIAAKQKGDVHGRVDHESVRASLHEVGCCLEQMAKYEEARARFESAVEAAQRGDVHGRVNYQGLSASQSKVGYCLEQLGQFEEAQRWFERADASRPL